MDITLSPPCYNLKTPPQLRNPPQQKKSFFFFYSPNKLAAPFIDEEVFRIYTRFQEDDVEKWHSNQMDHMVKSFKDLSFRREDLLIGLLRRYLGN